MLGTSRTAGTEYMNAGIALDSNVPTMSPVSADVLHSLNTEQENLASQALDQKSALEIATIINREDMRVASAVSKGLPQIAEAIDAIAQALAQGGRLIYVGAGSSGRIAALDASECPPTFGTDPKQVQYVMAGGERALGRASEASEDSRELGQRDIARLRPSKKDVVAGIAASGRTPYTIAAVEYAKKKGARTIGISCNVDSALTSAADIAITAEVGPEVVAGSSRMKAGTAQKMILNILTTGAMTRLGYVYGNLMVNVSVKNRKLRERAITILSNAANLDRGRASDALDKAGGSVPVALIMLKASVTLGEARRRLKIAAGNVRQAIEHSRSVMPSASKPHLP